MFYTISGNIVESMDNTQAPNALKNFKISEEYPLGGDCDEEYTAPFDRDQDTSLIDCAKKCLENPECKRFSFGKNNKSGGAGLSCRVSNNGRCPITVDRYKENNEKGIKLPFDHKKYSFNFWGGQVYDKKSKAELVEDNSQVTEVNNSKSVIKSRSQSSDVQIVNNKVIKSENITTNKEIVNGKVIKDEKIVNNLLKNNEIEESNLGEEEPNLGEEETNLGEEEESNLGEEESMHDYSDYTIYYITLIVLAILVISIYYIKK